MITRKSFFIRWLTVSSDDKTQEKRSVIEIRHIQSGATRRVSSPEEASQWMREIKANDGEKREDFEENNES